MRLRLGAVRLKRSASPGLLSSPTNSPVGGLGLRDGYEDACPILPLTVAEIIARVRGRPLARIRAKDGLAAIERGVASNAELARFFRRSQSNMSYAIGRLRQRLRDRERKIN